MYEFSVTPEFLLVLVAGLLALVFDYFPVVAKWFDGLEPSEKRLLNAGLVAGFAAVIFAGQCMGWFITNLICTVKGLLDLLYIVFLAISVNQGVHFGFRPSAAFKAKYFSGTIKNLAKRK